jgi:lipoprotein-anchoring transpeptidase ErfK/SrfK
MRLFDHHADPYPEFRQPRWRARLAIGIPFTIVLALVLNFALGAISPNVKASGAAHHTRHTRLASLLLPIPAAVRVERAALLRARNVAAVSPSTAPTPASTVTLSPVGQPHPTATKVKGAQGSYTGVSSTGMRMAPARDASLVPYSTLVAHFTRNIPGYPDANAIEKNRMVPGTWYGYPSSLPVVAQSHDRLKVRLAQRPDESESWIKKSDAILTVTHYAIVVDIAQHWIYVFRYGEQIGSFPVGDGAPGTPTPTGTYFVAFHAPPNGPGYGSVMLETSAHSRVIEHFEGGNDAIIAIHGPVGSDAEIGTHGASISNGCIRMHEWDLRQVAPVLNGSPVFLTD